MIGQLVDEQIHSHSQVFKFCTSGKLQFVLHIHEHVVILSTLGSSHTKVQTEQPPGKAPTKNVKQKIYNSNDKIYKFFKFKT